MLQSNVRRVWSALIFVALMITIAETAKATEPPAPGIKLDDKLSSSAKKNLEEMLKYSTQRGFTSLVREARQAREASEARWIANTRTSYSRQVAAGPALVRDTAVSGRKEFPVLAAKFSDSPADPYEIANLQRELFDGPWPTGTLTDYYSEVSQRRFSLGGTVFPWVTIDGKAEYFTGPKDCYGLCEDPANRVDYRTRIGEMVKAIVKANDARIDFSKYDNNGPDGIPNSGDDDGQVDYVAIVQPQIGGECLKGPAIWSRSFSLSDLGIGPVETDDVSVTGQKIMIDDFVVMPAFACDGKKMTSIGVFAHEFGHAFGLPDLYDTQEKSSGVGAWDLMGSGSWGGDGKTPETPTQMSAWSKEYLGWLKSQGIVSNSPSVRLRSSSTNPFAVKIDIDDKRAYLIEYRRKTGFDSSLLSAGLLVWYVDNDVLEPGIPANTVNADRTKPGLSVVEADNKSDLFERNNRGDDGDVFPGSSHNRNFDPTTSPHSRHSKYFGDIALCDIHEIGEVMTFDVRLGKSARCHH